MSADISLVLYLTDDQGIPTDENCKQIGTVSITYQFLIWLDSNKFIQEQLFKERFTGPITDAISIICPDKYDELCSALMLLTPIPYIDTGKLISLINYSKIEAPVGSQYYLHLSY